MEKRERESNNNQTVSAFKNTTVSPSYIILRYGKQEGNILTFRLSGFIFANL